MSSFFLLTTCFFECCFAAKDCVVKSRAVTTTEIMIENLRREKVFMDIAESKAFVVVVIEKFLIELLELFTIIYVVLVF